MPRYIDADKVMDEINRIGGHDLCEWETIGVKALIDRQPTADVVEVKHGRWKYNRFAAPSEKLYFCSLCVFGESDDGKDKYCSNCGAKMDEERKEE